MLVIGEGDGWSGITTSFDWEDDDSSEVDAKLKLAFFLLPCLLVGSREGISLDIFDDRVGNGWGGITISLDCDDGDSSEVDGKLELSFFLLPLLLVVRWEGDSFDVFDDWVGDGWGRITTSSCSLDCDDGDLSKVGGKLRLTLLLHFGVLR